ncbi:MAG: DUF167 domain-containing protein [Promethearchaeota archaeon]
MIEPHNKGTLLRIRVKPRSRKQAIILNEECSVHVKAVPTRGQANLEVVKVIAKALDIQSSRVHLISGKAAYNKIILIEEMDPKSVLEALRNSSLTL